MNLKQQKILSTVLLAFAVAQAGLGSGYLDDVQPLLIAHATNAFAVLVLSILSHFTRPKNKRAPLLAAETDPLDGMVHDVGDGGSEPEDESELDE